MTEYQPLIDAGHGEYLHRGAEPVDWASLAEPMAPSGAAAGAGLGRAGVHTAGPGGRGRVRLVMTVHLTAARGPAIRRPGPQHVRARGAAGTTSSGTLARPCTAPPGDQRPRARHGQRPRAGRRTAPTTP